MDSAQRQRRLARRALWGSVVIGLGVIGYFGLQGEFVTATVVGALLIGGGYFEYRRRLRDLEMIDGDAEEDPFERRERFR
ncbi:hypothetical protein [Halalkalicoccus tibetensis]|uniref:PEP-CTERM protein-sorting domain-containing protein n=1 Tax=Halalkalicoccus tibetensis TaxID=175632 RepID=A0ABD5V6X1_9EURY